MATTLTPEQAVPVQLSFSGTADPGTNSNLEAVVRPSGGLACQANYASDLSAAGAADTILFSDNAESVTPGAYELGSTFKPPAASGYQVCAWISQPTGTGAQTVSGPATTGFSARQPQVSQLTLAVPESLTPGIVFQLAYTTQTDQQLTLYSVVKKAGALPCADSYELEQQQSQPETTLLGALDTVFGGPTTTRVTTRQKAGSYLVCSWIEGPSAGEVDGTLSTPVTVGTPAPPKPTSNPAQIKLQLGTVTASRRHGVSVAGTTARAFTGRLAALAACGSSTKRTRAQVHKGASRSTSVCQRLAARISASG